MGCTGSLGGNAEEQSPLRHGCPHPIQPLRASRRGRVRPCPPTKRPPHILARPRVRGQSNFLTYAGAREHMFMLSTIPAARMRASYARTRGWFLRAIWR